MALRRVFFRGTVADIGSPHVDGTDCLYDGGDASGDGNTSYVGFAALIGLERTHSTCQVPVGLPAGAVLTGCTVSLLVRTTALLPAAVQIECSAAGTAPVVTVVDVSNTSSYTVKTATVAITAGALDTATVAAGEFVRLGLSSLAALNSTRITTAWLDLTYTQPVVRTSGAVRLAVSVTNRTRSAVRAIGAARLAAAVPNRTKATLRAAGSARYLASAASRIRTGLREAGAYRVAFVTSARAAELTRSAGATRITASTTGRGTASVREGGATRTVASSTGRSASLDRNAGAYRLVDAVKTGVHSPLRFVGASRMATATAAHTNTGLRSAGAIRTVVFTTERDVTALRSGGAVRVADLLVGRESTALRSGGPTRVVPSPLTAHDETVVRTAGAYRTTITLRMDGPAGVLRLAGSARVVAYDCDRVTAVVRSTGTTRHFLLSPSGTPTGGRLRHGTQGGRTWTSMSGGRTRSGSFGGRLRGR